MFFLSYLLKVTGFEARDK